MSAIDSFKDLDVYKKSYCLALQIYQTTRGFPKEEAYGLTSQLRRAAISIPSNIAEGYRRCSRPDYIRFLRIAFGSCGELESQLDLSRDMGLINESEYAELGALHSDVSKMLNRLMRTLGE